MNAYKHMSCSLTPKQLRVLWTRLHAPQLVALEQQQMAELLVDEQNVIFMLTPQQQKDYILEKEAIFTADHKKELATLTPGQFHTLSGNALEALITIAEAKPLLFNVAVESIRRGQFEAIATPEVSSMLKERAITYEVALTSIQTPEGRRQLKEQSCLHARGLFSAAQATALSDALDIWQAAAALPRPPISIPELSGNNRGIAPTNFREGRARRQSAIHTDSFVRMILPAGGKGIGGVGGVVV